MKLLHKLSNFIEKDAWIQFKNSVIFTIIVIKINIEVKSIT